MKNQIKISPYQFFCLVVLFLLGSTVILQSLTAAGRDTWISTLLALVPGLIAAAVISYNTILFPELTLIEYLQAVFGKLIGKLIGILYLWYFLYLGSLVLLNYGFLIGTAVMPETAPAFFNTTLALVVLFLVYNKLEVMGRVGELALPLALIISLLTSFLINLAGITDSKNLLPVMENGLTPVLIGTVPVAAFPFQEVVVFAMILPYVNSIKKGIKAFTGGIILAWILLVMTMVQTISIFGLYAATLTFPRYYSVRMITIGEFIQRIEAGILSVWVVGGLIKIGICLFAFALGLSQLTGIRDFKTLVVPSAFLMVIMANISFKNIFEMLNFATNIYPLYAFPFQLVFPVLVLTAGLIKKRKSKPSQ